MSEFKKLVETVLKNNGYSLKEYYTKSGNYTNDPQDAYDGEDEYYDWLDNQDYKEGYAVFVKKDEKGKDLFACADKTVPNDLEYTLTTDIYGDDPKYTPDVFEYGKVDTEEEAKQNAENFAKEWKQYHPEAETTIVKVYAKDEDGYEFHRTKEEVYPFENWDYGDYIEDQKFAAADAWWEDHKEE